MPPEIRWQIPVDDDATTAIYQQAVGTDHTEAPLFVCAHGAGGNLADRAMVQMATALVERGLSVVRFNFLYREKGSGRPDPMPRLERCMDAVTSFARRELSPSRLIIGGRSMGGRAASMSAARGYECDGLLLLAYPLHPPGKPEKLRDAHLPDISVPVLCFNGTRDPFSQPQLMTEVLERVGDNWTMEWVEGADHSFHVLKSSGTNDAAVLRGIADRAADWARSL